MITNRYLFSAGSMARCLPNSRLSSITLTEMNNVEGGNGQQQNSTVVVVLAEKLDKVCFSVKKLTKYCRTKHGILC